MVVKKDKLGGRHQCSECDIKFYDLNRPNPVCPKCGGKPRLDFKPKVKSSKPTVDLDFEPEEAELPNDEIEMIPLDEAEEDFSDFGEETLV